MAENSVTLEWYEQLAAALCGSMRYCFARKQGSHHIISDWENSIWKDICAAGAEVAVAKFLNAYWPFSINTFKSGADVGRNIEVRLVGELHHRLVVRPDDPSERWYVLVRGKFPDYEVAGYLKGLEAKQSCWLTDAGKTAEPQCYMVPNDRLKQLRAAPFEVKAEVMR